MLQSRTPDSKIHYSQFLKSSATSMTIPGSREHAALLGTIENVYVNNYFVYYPIESKEMTCT